MDHVLFSFLWGFIAAALVIGLLYLIAALVVYRITRKSKLRRGSLL